MSINIGRVDSRAESPWTWMFCRVPLSPETVWRWVLFGQQRFMMCMVETILSARLFFNIGHCSCSMIVLFVMILLYRQILSMVCFFKKPASNNEEKQLRPILGWKRKLVRIRGWNFCKRDFMNRKCYKLLMLKLAKKENNKNIYKNKKT